ncbi:MAG: hypothetical protein ILO36_04845 [Abditibacteriota bacterium]|nr:hypothetical protein [Abditibacteriota bacterium]
MKNKPNVFAIVTVIACFVLVCMIFISGSNLLQALKTGSAGGFYAPFPAIDSAPQPVPLTIPEKCAPYLYDSNIYSAFVTEKSYTVFIEKKLIYEPFSKKHVLYTKTESDRSADSVICGPGQKTRLKENTSLYRYPAAPASPAPGCMPRERVFYRLASPEGKVLWEDCRFVFLQKQEPVKDVRRFSDDSWLILTDSAPNALYVNTRTKVTTAYTALPHTGKAPDIRFLRYREAKIAGDNEVEFECPGNAVLGMRICLSADDVRKNITDKHDMDRQVIRWNGKEADIADVFPAPSFFRKRPSVKDALAWDCRINKPQKPE